MKYKFPLWLFSILTLVSGSALASGGFSDLGPPPGGQAPVVDQVYVYGKSIYKGRAEGAEKIKYCVKVDGEVKKLRGSTAKLYRKGPVRDFALALIDCANPERLALTTMSRDHVPVILYYLNKRYRLKLSEEPS